MRKGFDSSSTLTIIVLNKALCSKDYKRAVHTVGDLSGSHTYATFFTLEENPTTDE
jgi:hypothetical protein